MTEVIIHISNRSIVNMNDFKNAFRSLKDGKYLITIKDIRKRSLPQNSYYWAVIVPMVKKGLYDAGYDAVRTNEDAHEIMKHIFLQKKMESKNNGDVIWIAGSTASLSIPDFNSFIEEVCRWASDYLGIVIPSPYEQMAEFDNWEKDKINEVSTNL